MFPELERINRRPAPFSTMTIRELWDDPHISERMLRYHLDDSVDAASRASGFVDRSAAWIAETFACGPGTRVVDLGCGPGLYAQRLARTGATVSGVDFSGRSIRHARAAAEAEDLPITYVEADYLAWAPGERFDLAMMIFGDYGAMSPPQRRTLLGRVDDLLADGGAFLFDVASTAALADLEETAAYAPRMMDGFWSPAPYYGFLNTFVYPDERVSVDRYEIVEAHRTRTFWTWIQYFDPATLGDELAASGFAVERLLGNVAGDPYDPGGAELAVVARRTARERPDATD